MARAYTSAAAVTACLFFAAVISGCVLQEQPRQIKEESFNYTTYFCPGQECLQAVSAQLQTARLSISCAFYSVDSSLLADTASFSTAAKITLEVVVDKNSKVPEKFIQGSSQGGFVLKRGSRGIMHDKYCVIDGSRIITGSFNPAAAAKNDYNNILIINSTALASFYSSDFQRLKAGDNKKTPTTAAVASKELKQKTAILNKTAVEAYFCPQDGCLEAVKNKLKMANDSIIFAAYSFTHPEIANELILKRSEGIAVSGVIEKSTTGSKYSKHAVLAENGVNVYLETSKRLMHHKFFVVDNRTVITGSFNPTENADTRNDENIIIIENPAVAEEYIAEFHRIYGGSIVTE
ncbi:hypothetical protein HYU40_05200 [Candidatus Woesearchaeota archaeon]|nr:hypothetical protein [Candidatus Woesearchaeota archaeon]